MEGNCSTGQRRQWAVVPMEEEGHLGDLVIDRKRITLCICFTKLLHL